MPVLRKRAKLSTNRGPLSAPNGLKYISGSFCDIYCLILETAAMPKLSLSNLDDNK